MCVCIVCQFRLTVNDTIYNCQAIDRWMGFQEAIDKSQYDDGCENCHLVVTMMVNVLVDGDIEQKRAEPRDSERANNNKVTMNNETMMSH